MESLQVSGEIVQIFRGQQLELESSQGDQAVTGTQSDPTPVSAGTSPGPAIPAPSTQHESQASPTRPQDMDDIGGRMTDLDLANRAPVRTGRQMQGRQ